MRSYEGERGYQPMLAVWAELNVADEFSNANVCAQMAPLNVGKKAVAARPKRLRFLIFNTPGRLVHHARRIVLQLATTAARLAEWLEAVRLLPIRV